jgi:hypothetical protein
MKRSIEILAIAIVMIIIMPSYAQAQALTSFDQDFNFRAIGSADETQNNLDPAEKTNADTWDPVPNGVYFGGYPIESKLRLDDVPDTDFVAAYATVCRFGSEIIMSGAARTTVRLPMHTSDDPWSWAVLNIYEISQDSNWTFSRYPKVALYPGYDLGHMRVNFTAGSHSLIFWSNGYSPTDLSPTNYNDHFTRSNRTYCFVDAPIKPNVLYLFITYVQYASDKYVETYFQPDSLDSEGEVNRSTLAIYNEQAPDAYTLSVDHFNVSFGYSFDFVNGFGNSCYGLNIWAQAGDELEFWIYHNVSLIDDSYYPTFHLPFRASTDNVSFDVLVQIYDPVLGGHNDYFRHNNVIANDFLLISSQDTWGTNRTAWQAGTTTYSNWFKIVVYINNDTRLWIPMWDTHRPTGNNATINQTWLHSWFEPIWDSEPEFEYNLEQWIQHEVQGVDADSYNYHFKPQAALQFNDYYWSKNTPPVLLEVTPRSVENMTLGQKFLYGLGACFLKVGTYMGVVNYPLGQALRYAGTATQLFAMYGDLPDIAGYVWDKLQVIRDFFSDIGTWLWRAAQFIMGVLSAIIDILSVILAVAMLILAIVVFFLPIYVTFRMALAFRNAMLGDLEKASDEMGKGIAMVKAVSGR